MAVQIARDEWMKALGDAIEPCDPSAMTTPELAAMFSISEASVQRRIRKLLAEGKATRTWKKITMATGVQKRVPAYLLKKR